MNKLCEWIGPIVLISPFWFWAGYKDIRQISDLNRLGSDLRNASTIEYIVQRGDTYQLLQERFFPLNHEYPGINEWGNSPEFGVNLYRSSVRVANNWSILSFCELKEGTTIRIPTK
jgi:hypothetical protein